MRAKYPPMGHSQDPADYIRGLRLENQRLKSELEETEQLLWQARNEAETYRACIGVDGKFSWEGGE